MRRAKYVTSWLVLCVTALGFASTARATDITLGKHIIEVKVSGDLRIRQETFSNSLGFSNTASSTTILSGADRGRSRQRYRLRLGLELPLHPKLVAKLRFASGTGEQVSTNQSFDNLSSQNGLFIDLAQLEYKPFSTLKLRGGRMDLPLWTQYSSDIIWDADFSPMGFGAMFEKLVGPANVFANAMYMVADEDSANAQGTDQSELSAQIGAEFQLPFESRLKAGFAQHQWINERGSIKNNAGDFGQLATVNQGNRRIAGKTLANEFRVNEITAQFSFWLSQIPVAAQATLITNVGALDPNAGMPGFVAGQAKKDKGSQIGFIVGKAGAPKSWEVAYFVKDSEWDSTVADVADSDWGNGGTGRKGSVMWASFSPTDYTNLKLKYFVTELEDGAKFPFTAGIITHDLNRMQLDFQVKF